MVRPREDLWGLSPSLRPWEAWGSLMDPCGRFRPVGPPRSSCDAYFGRVCHCHCGSDRCSRHPVRLVWVNGSFGCRTIAARSRDLILDTILPVTSNYSTVPVLLLDPTKLPNPHISLKWGCGPPPLFRGSSLVPAAMLGCYRAPPRVCSKGGGVKRTQNLWPMAQRPVSRHTCADAVDTGYLCSLIRQIWNPIPNH